MCLFPLTAYWSKEFGSNGKRLVTFDRGQSFSGVPLRLPCGQCVQCRLKHSLNWAVRCMHEKQLHSDSMFVTLTYDDDNLPNPPSLSVKEHQRFMYRFRKKFGDGTRFYMCGEYGTNTRRPHYHYLFFNRDVGDRKFYKHTGRGDKLYTSKVLSDLWPNGYAIVGDVTLESCSYVARYICDKITGDRAATHYAFVDDDGVIHQLRAELTAMSRRPGIGAEWYAKFGRHSHLSGDFVVLDGKRTPMPRFYDARFELTGGDLDEIKKRRLTNARRHRKNNTLDRRRVREVVMLKKLKLFERNVG